MICRSIRLIEGVSCIYHMHNIINFWMLFDCIQIHLGEICLKMPRMHIFQYFEYESRYSGLSHRRQYKNRLRKARTLDVYKQAVEWQLQYTEIDYGTRRNYVFYKSFLPACAVDQTWQFYICYWAIWVIIKSISTIITFFFFGLKPLIKEVDY